MMLRGQHQIEFFKRIDFVYEATYDELIKVEGIGDKLAKIIVENKDLSKSKEIYYKCKRSKIKINNIWRKLLRIRLSINTIYTNTNDSI